MSEQQLTPHEDVIKNTQQTEELYTPIPSALALDELKQRLLIYSEDQHRARETTHPFQDFLYALRSEGLSTSTSEWLDLQKMLEAGEVQSLDDLYIVARALLVKDVTGYPMFDTVFGRMFYNIEPPQSSEEDDNYEDQYEEEQQEDEQQEDEEEPEKEQEEVKEKNDSQEIVEPGETEEHHGGDDVHKEIEDSKSSGNEGGGKPKQDSKSQLGGNQQEGKGGGEKKEESKGGGKKNEDGKGGNGKEKNDAGGGKRLEKSEGVMREGKGGFSARERVLERRYDQYDKERIISYDQFGRVLSRLTTILEEASDIPTSRLNPMATVKNIARNAGLPEFVWREEVEDKPNVIVMFDVGGSTDEFRPIMEKLFAAAKDYLRDLEVFYFHNAIYGEVWPQKDGNWGKHFIPLQEILKKDTNSKVIIVGDAWMADQELWDSYEDFDREKGKNVYHPSGIESFEQLREQFENIVWINPILEKNHEEWDNSGTIEAIKKIFPMYDLTLKGLEKAVSKLVTE